MGTKKKKIERVLIVTECNECPFNTYHYPTHAYGPIVPELYDGKYNHCKRRKDYKGFGSMKEMFYECPLPKKEI